MSAGVASMGATLRILVRIARRSALMTLFGLLIALMPGIFYLLRPDASQGALNLVGTCAMLIGFPYGATCSDFWGDEARGLVPGYWRQLRDAAFVGGLLWWGTIMLPVVSALGLAGPPARLVEIALVAWAAVGTGFLVGFFMLRAVNRWLRAAMVLAITLPFVMFNGWIGIALLVPWFDVAPGYMPVVLLALGCGPLLWRVLLDPARVPPRLWGTWGRPLFPTQGAVACAGSPSNGGRWSDAALMDEWFRLFARWPSWRAAFVALRPNIAGLLINLGVLPVAIILTSAFGVDVFAGAIAGIYAMVLVNVVMLSVITPARGCPGRYALLPGSPQRRQLPALLLAWQSAHLLAGALTLVPAAIIALWVGASPGEVSRAAFALICAVLVAASLGVAYEAGARRAGSGARLFVAVLLGMVIGAVGTGVADDAPRLLQHMLWSTTPIIALACIAYALRRWRHGEIGI